LTVHVLCAALFIAVAGAVNYIPNEDSLNGKHTHTQFEKDSILTLMSSL